MFCYPALELFVLFDSSRAFPLSIPVDNNEATWKKATKYNKIFSTWCNVHYECLIVLSGVFIICLKGGKIYQITIGNRYINGLEVVCICFLLSLYTIYWSSSLILSDMCCHYIQQLFSSRKSTVMKTTVKFKLFLTVFLYSVFINPFTSAADCQAGNDFFFVGLNNNIPYARHYNPRFVYFLPTF